MKARPALATRTPDRIAELERRYSCRMAVSSDHDFKKIQEDTMSGLLSGLLKELPGDVAVVEFNEDGYMNYQLDGEGVAASFTSMIWPWDEITFGLTILELKEDGNVTD